MKELKKIHFYESTKDVNMGDLTLYFDGWLYKVIHEFGHKITGQIFSSKVEAIEYFDKTKKEITDYYHSQQIIYTIK